MNQPVVFVGPGAFYQDVVKLFRARNFHVLTAEEVGKVPAQILVLTGGADINPRLYGQYPLQQTHFFDGTDRLDIKFFDAFKDKPKIGICRGGQLLNVLSGGEMWQHVDNHNAGKHYIIDTRSGRQLKVTSIHHQMMIPNSDGVVLATTTVSKTRIKGSAVDKDQKYPNHEINFKDIEAVWYENTKSLCYQPHPEVDETEGQDYFFDLVDEYIRPLL